jgi:nucleotide-binding universal stress UspA family protein
MRVLIALDGSKLGENAAAAIGSWAREVGANVVLMAVRHPDDIHETYAPTGYAHALTPKGTASGQPLYEVSEPGPVSAEDRTQALERARVDTEEYLSGVADRDLEGVACKVHVEWSEETAEAIAHCAEEKNADFIAMGTHGRSGLSHALLGSVAEAVVRRSSMPVLLVREGMHLARGE